MAKHKITVWPIIDLTPALPQNCRISEYFFHTNCIPKKHCDEKSDGRANNWVIALLHLNSLGWWPHGLPTTVWSNEENNPLLVSNLVMLPFTLLTFLLISCCPDVDGANEADAKVARFQICWTIFLCYLDLTEEINPNTKIREKLVFFDSGATGFPDGA